MTTIRVARLRPANLAVTAKRLSFQRQLLSPTSLRAIVGAQAVDFAAVIGYTLRMANRVTVYTDGACSGNPGPGGWGAILVSGALRKEISGGDPATTNNQPYSRRGAEAQGRSGHKNKPINERSSGNPCSESSSVVPPLRLSVLSESNERAREEASELQPLQSRFRDT